MRSMHRKGSKYMRKIFQRYAWIRNHINDPPQLRSVDEFNDTLWRSIQSLNLDDTLMWIV